MDCDCSLAGFRQEFWHPCNGCSQLQLQHGSRNILRVYIATRQPQSRDGIPMGGYSGKATTLALRKLRAQTVMFTTSYGLRIRQMYLKLSRCLPSAGF